MPAMVSSANRILIIGASGSGTTTLGKKLSQELNYPHIDGDDLFWFPTYPPFTKFRNREELKLLVNTEVLTKERWVFSGSPCGWGDEIIPHLDLIIFLIVPTEERVSRIIKREKQRYGTDIEPDGIMYESHLAFLEWTKKYDAGDITGRSMALHENWLRSALCPVLRFEGNLQSDYIFRSVLNHISTKSDSNTISPSISPIDDIQY